MLRTLHPRLLIRTRTPDTVFSCNDHRCEAFSIECHFVLFRVIGYTRAYFSVRQKIAFWDSLQIWVRRRWNREMLRVITEKIYSWKYFLLQIRFRHFDGAIAVLSCIIDQLHSSAWRKILSCCSELLSDRRRTTSYSTVNANSRAGINFWETRMLLERSILSG